MMPQLILAPRSVDFSHLKPNRMEIHVKKTSCGGKRGGNHTTAVCEREKKKKQMGSISLLVYRGRVDEAKCLV